MLIGIDLDSVLNDLEYRWAEWIKLHHDPTFSVDKWVSWDIASLTPAGNLVYDYLSLRGTFANLCPRDGAVSGFRHLSERHDVLVVSTAHPNVVADKAGWCQKHLGIDPYEFIPLKQKSLLRIDVLVDDGLHNFDGFGGYGIVFDQPWNRVLPESLAKNAKILRAHGWLDVERLIGQIEGFESGQCLVRPGDTKEQP